MPFKDTAEPAIAEFLAARTTLKTAIEKGFEAYGYSSLYGNQPAHLPGHDHALVLGMVLAHPNLTADVLIAKIKEVGEVRRKHVEGGFSLP